MITANGCQDTIVQEVKSYFIPDVDFNVPAPCLNGATALFDATTVGDTTAVSWNWTFEDTPTDGTSTDQDPTYSFNTSGLHLVTLTVTSAYGCDSTLVQSIDVLPGPIADFEVLTSPSGPQETVNFNDLSTPGDSDIITWEWIFGDGDTTKFFEQNTTHAYADEGEYDVDLIVVDEDGCRDTATQDVIIFHGPQVPTAFSPNGDGENDNFMILGGNYEAIDFKVYNNWGEIVFETTDPESPGWDGTHKGAPQPIGVFVYIAVVTTYDGAEHTLNGDVSLIR